MPLIAFSSTAKGEFYEEVVAHAGTILQGQRNWCTNLANVAAMLYHSFHASPDPKHQKVNWVGFYLANDRHSPSVLWLGPFQGKIACTSIDFDRGICGLAASSQSTQVISDVHDHPSHIACDPNSKSEIVIPLANCQGRVLGVLDVDCAEVDGFTEEDK
ncbi:hypothetical protein H4R34_005394, partial [Dimargaris verticillata]